MLNLSHRQRLRVRFCQRSKGKTNSYWEALNFRDDMRAARLRMLAPMAKTLAPAQMKANETMRSGVRASPAQTPQANCSVGARNWMKPRVDRGRRRADQANRTRGMTVAGPLTRAQARPAGEANPVAWPCVASQARNRAPMGSSTRHSTNNPVWAEAGTRFRITA